MKKQTIKQRMVTSWASMKTMKMMMKMKKKKLVGEAFATMGFIFHPLATAFASIVGNL